jgi:hypothetical protein
MFLFFSTNVEIYLNSRNEMLPISQHVMFIFIRIIILLTYK